MFLPENVIFRGPRLSWGSFWSISPWKPCVLSPKCCDQHLLYLFSMWTYWHLKFTQGSTHFFQWFSDCGKVLPAQLHDHHHGCGEDQFIYKLISSLEVQTKFQYGFEHDCWFRTRVLFGYPKIDNTQGMAINKNAEDFTHGYTIHIHWKLVFIHMVKGKVGGRKSLTRIHLKIQK